MGYIIWAIIIISVLRAIFSADPKKKSDNQRARNRAAADSGSGGRPSLDELTRRKREQLQELARQQRGGAPGAAGGAPGGGEPDPGNMTMAERIARARAKQQYEQRAAQAGQSRAAPTSARPQPASRVGNTTQQQRASALQQKMEARRQQQREALARRQQQIQKARAQRATPTRPAQQPPAPPRRPAAVPQGITDAPEHEPVRRTLADAEPTTKPEDSSRSLVDASPHGADQPIRRNAADLSFAKLSNAELRRAFILKEVLDRPVAERDPVADVNGG
ncbi:MAG: hypothetical protein AAF333_19390 [Planctomycetota bacterium]